MIRRLSILAAALLAAGCSRGKVETVKPEAPPAAAGAREIGLSARMQSEGGVAVEAVAVRSLPQVLRANGRIPVNDNRPWRVGAMTEGRIMRVLANVGDAVSSGQVLARMHSHEIHEARAVYRKAVADLAQARSQEEYVTRTRDRAKRLHDLKAASLEQVEHAEAELHNSQTARVNAEGESERARQHLIEYLQIPVGEPKPHTEGEEEPDEDLIPIRAPASGTLLTRNITAGTVVAPSTELFVITDLASLWMIAAVSEENLPKLRVGLPARVFVQAYPEHPFVGRITRLGEELAPTTRTIKARVELPNSGGRLKPEMYATAEIEAGGSEPAIFIPQTAPQEVGGQRVVFVRRAADRFEVRPVEIGRTLEGSLEVVRGLKAGEALVVRGSFLLKSQLLKSSLAGE
ncbi:MAG: efflux RND transporter periplasmic adaptor subunit [Acidobacteria bacterium]|nr:efflux RND transporter periplasmic adaptor subunit [Acidobacteriota bacterium]